MNTTSNLGLKKPEQTEFYNVDDFNDNADVIDSKFSPSTGHKHTGAAGDAPQIGTDGIADGAVTAAKVGPDVATQAELDAVSAVANAAKTRADAALPKDGSEAFTGDFSASKPRANIAGTNQYAFFNGKQRAHLCSNAYNDGEWKRYDTALPAAALTLYETGKLQINFAPAGANPIVWTTYEVFHTGNDGAGSGLDADTVRGYVPVNKAGDTITGDITVNGAIRTRNGLDLIFIGDDAVIEDFDTANSIRIKGRQNPTIADIYLGTSNNRVWHTGMLRTTNGYLEVLIGGSWRPVGGAVKVQRGQATIPAANNYVNVTVSSIADLTKAYPIISFTGFDKGIRATLTSATNLELYRNQTSSIDTLITWQIIEHVG